MVTAKQKRQIREFSPELKLLKKWLSAVKHNGKFPIVKLMNKGLIKEHTLKRGKLIGGRIIGSKKKWVLTEKGKQMWAGLAGLGF